MADLTNARFPNKKNVGSMLASKHGPRKAWNRSVVKAHLAPAYPDVPASWKYQQFRETQHINTEIGDVTWEWSALSPHNNNTDHWPDLTFKVRHGLKGTPDVHYMQPVGDHIMVRLPAGGHKGTVTTNPHEGLDPYPSPARTLVLSTAISYTVDEEFFNCALFLSPAFIRTLEPAAQVISLYFNEGRKVLWRPAGWIFPVEFHTFWSGFAYDPPRPGGNVAVYASNELMMPVGTMPTAFPVTVDWYAAVNGGSFLP